MFWQQNHWTSLWSMQKDRLKQHHWGLCEVILKEVTSTHRLWRQTTKPIFLREKNYLMSWYLQKLSHYYLRRNWFYFSTKLLFNPIPVPRNDSQNKVWNRRGQQTCSGNWIVCIQVKPILVGDQIHSQTKVTESPRSTNLLSQKEH
jgi:hypothetical protein